MTSLPDGVALHGQILPDAGAYWQKSSNFTFAVRYSAARGSVAAGARAGAGAGAGRSFPSLGLGTGTVQNLQIQNDFETQCVQSTLAFECIIQFIQKIVTRSSLA